MQSKCRRNDQSDWPKGQTSSESVWLAYFLFAFLLLFCVCVQFLTLSLAFSNNMYLIEKNSAFPFVPFVVMKLTINAFSWVYKLGFCPFCSPLGMASVCLWKQTDSEQTDFAFDGEMTATEVCTWRKDVICKAWKRTDGKEIKHHVWDTHI